MSVKRIPDPAGIRNDLVLVNIEDADGEAEMKALMEIFDAGDAAPRIDSLRSFPSLAHRVAWLDRRMATVGEDSVLHARLRAAEAIAYELAARPGLSRDRKLQNAKKKPRRPDIDAWLDKAILHDAYAKAPALWADAPRSITDQIGEGSFKKRLTKARKRAACK